MRRFFVWSALAALIGLLLAGGGYWAYWTFYARFQPVVVSRDAAEIQRLLDSASWVGAGGGGEPVWLIGYRSSEPLQRYEVEEGPKLRAAGADLRIIVFARPDDGERKLSTAAERATVAELWLTRDWELYQRWTATPSRNWTAAGLPSADDVLARASVVAVSREFARRLSGHLKKSGVRHAWPIVLWRDREGYLKACACDDARSWAFIRDDLGAPDRVASEAPSSEVEPPAPMAYPLDGSPPAGAAPSLAYPTLPPLPGENGPVDGGGPTSEAAPRASTPSDARPSRPRAPAAPRAAPTPQQQDDATFF